MDSQKLQNLVDELIQKTIEIKKLEDNIIQLKLSIYDDAKGGLVGLGGKVVFKKGGKSESLSKDLLVTNLISNFDIAASEAQNFLDKCKTITDRTPSVVVYLD